MNMAFGASPGWRHLTVLPPPGTARREGQGQEHSSPRKTPVGNLCQSSSAANRMWVTTGQTLKVKSGPEEVNYSICVCVYIFRLSLFHPPLFLSVSANTHSLTVHILSAVALTVPPVLLNLHPLLQLKLKKKNARKINRAQASVASHCGSALWFW